MDLTQIEMLVRVGIGQDWKLAQNVQDIAERVGVLPAGGSPEQGQLFYRCRGFKTAAFRQACKEAGFIASF
jgi:hypothetical protein